MKAKKPTYQELEKKLAEAEAQIISLRGFTPETAGTEIHIAEGERNIAENERDVAENERDIAEVERNAAAEDKHAAAEDKREAAEVKRDVAEDKRDAAEDKRDATEEKRDTAVLSSLKIEEELIKSETRYRNLVEETSVGIAIIDTTGKFTFVNDAICQMVGYSRQEILGKPFGFFLHPDDKNQMLAIFAEASTRPQKRLNLEFRGIDKQGNIIYLSTAPTILRHEDKIYGFSAIIQDITERKNNELKLSESQKKFQALVETTNDFIWEMNLNGVYTYCSPQMEKLWGLKPEEMLGKTPFDLLPPEDREQAIKAFSALSESLSPFINMEIRSFDGTGHIKILEISGVPFFDIAGKPGGYRGITRDITKRKRSEEALKDSEERYRTLFESAAEGIFIADSKNKNIKYANPAICKMFGYTPEELIKMNVSDIHPKTSLEHVLAEFIALTKGEKTLASSLPCLKKDGTIFYADIKGDKAIIDGADCSIGFFTDITERKRAEEALKDSEEKFHSIVEHSNDGIIFVQNGRISYFNSKMLELGGHTADEIAYKPFLDFVAPQDKKKVAEIYSKRIAGEDMPERYELTLLAKGGRSVYVEISASLFKYKGEVADMALVRDITKRKKAEEALTTSEKNNRLLADYYKRLNNISITFNEAIDTADLFEKIAESFRLLTGAIAASFSAYDQEARVLKVMSLSIDSILRDSVFSMLGTDIFKMRIPVSTDDIEQMLTQGIRRPKDLHELSSGELPRDISDSVMDAIKCQQIVALAISYAGEIIGTCVAYLRGDQPVVPDEALKTYISFSGLAIKRKQAEEALQKSNKLLNDTGEMAKVGGWEIDLLTQSGAWSEEVCRIHGVEPGYKPTLEEAINFYAPESRPSLKAAIKRVAETGEPYNLEALFIPRGSEDKIWVRTMGKAIYSGGKIVKITGTFQDITERKQAEEALRQSEALYRSLFENMLNGFAYCKMLYNGDQPHDFIYLSVNDSFEKLTGLKNVTGKKVSEVLPGVRESDPKFFGVYGRVASSGIPESFESFLNALGIWLHVSVYSPEKDYFVAVFDNINDRKQAEERINHLNITLRSIRNVNQLITREADRDKLIQGVCNSLVASHSFSSTWIVLLNEALKPATWAAVDNRGHFSALIEEFQQGNYPLCVQKALKQKNVVITADPHTMCPGCPILGEAAEIGSMTVRLETAGNIFGVLCASLPRDLLADEDEISLFSEVAEDISFALHNIDLRAKNEFLEQEQLRAAKLESIGTLAGGIAHDFNNLLTGIMGNIGLAKASIKAADPAYEMLGEAENASVRARDLTRQLLTFAKGGKPIKKQVDIARLIRESATFALRGSNVKLEMSLPDNLLPVDADESQVSQVINNLVINADEAMPSGGVLYIKASNVALKKNSGLPMGSGPFVYIEIKDTGMGMSPENLQKIFEPYFTTKQRGSGLGLTTAYSIVKSHSGYITAESVQNKGSTFHIYLPASKKTAKGRGKVAKADSVQAGGKVLVMDDEEIIRKMLKNMLNLAGYEVALSADGQEALEKYAAAMDRQDPFDAVIMDLTIPGGMGGKETIKKLLKLDPQAAVIVSSGYATDPIMSEYKKFGFKAVIAKPYSIRQLQDSLSAVPKRKLK